MPFGRDVGLGPGDIELDGDPTPPGKGALQHFTAHFSARVRVNCGPCLLWPNGGYIRIPHGTQVGIGQVTLC